MRHQKIFVGEFLGTMILILGGPGSAILAGPAIGVLGVALAFGLSLLVVAYAIGPISGAHINPAVTAAMAMARKVEASLVPTYIVAQVLGGIAGGGIIWLIANNRDGFDAGPSNFAVNGWANLSPGGYGFGAMVVVEVVFTALLVLAVLATTGRGFAAVASGLTVGLALTLIHLVTIPVDNTSVNPARSVAVAVFAGGDALEQLWAFIVFPLIGAAVGVGAWIAVEDTAQASESTVP